MESTIGTSRAAASASACGDHCCQCTGLLACWRRYGLVACPSVFVAEESGGFIVGSWRSWRPMPLLCDFCDGLADRVGALVGGLIGLRVRGVIGSSSGHVVF